MPKEPKDRATHGSLLEVIACLGGAAVMVLELAGSRVLAPQVGTSLPVWTSLIGVILGSLALGYYLGGRLSDQRPSLRILAWIIFSAGAYIAGVSVVQVLFLGFLTELIVDIRFISIVATMVLFAPPSVLLGMIAPYVVRLRIRTVESSGETVGRLYAISTIGSIGGTFTTGFWLIPHLGTTYLLFLLGAVLIALSLGTNFRARTATKLGVVVVLIGALATQVSLGQMAAENAGVSLETRYGHVEIYEGEIYDEPMKVMSVNAQINSVMSLKDDLAVYGYVRYFDLARYFSPKVNKALMIGGGAYSYPRYFLDQEPDAEIDVVEIDPEVTAIARAYFKLEDDPRLRIHHQDGRVFLNRTEETYDAILIDAYSALHTLPFQLTTREAIVRIHERLNNKGAVVVNMISAINGPLGKFLRAEYRTYQSVFTFVVVFQVQSKDPLAKQNLILVAVKGVPDHWRPSPDPRMRELLNTLWNEKIQADLPILTDDKAPVEVYIAETL